eukprot:8105616-Ditylum_brightwellii.AAC.1
MKSNLDNNIAIGYDMIQTMLNTLEYASIIPMASLCITKQNNFKKPATMSTYMQLYTWSVLKLSSIQHNRRSKAP